MKWKSYKDDNEYNDNDYGSGIGIGGFGFGGGEKLSVGKKKLPVIKPGTILEGDWYHLTNKPLYHKGDKNFRAEGPGVIKFQTIENDVKYIAFAKINPLSKNPVDPKLIYKIRADSPSLINVPIVWRFNIESINTYEKRKKLQGNSFIGKSIKKDDVDDGKVISIDPKIALFTDIKNTEPSLTVSDIPLTEKNIGNTINQLNKYYSVSLEHAKNSKKKSYDDEFYSDDEDEDDESNKKEDDEEFVGESIGKDLHSKDKKKTEFKPKHMFNVAIKFQNGNIKWFSWPEFVKFQENDDISNGDKSQIQQAINILEKSESETWDLLSKFNE